MPGFLEESDEDYDEHENIENGAGMKSPKSSSRKNLAPKPRPRPTKSGSVASPGNSSNANANAANGSARPKPRVLTAKEKAELEKLRKAEEDTDDFFTVRKTFVFTQKGELTWFCERGRAEIGKYRQAEGGLEQV